MVTGGPPYTLSIDFGATLVKHGVSDAAGLEVGDSSVQRAPSPCSPDRFLLTISELAESAEPFDRVSVGFPGMVRSGVVLSAPLFSSGRRGLEPPDPALVSAWQGYSLREHLESRFARPVCVVNDSAMHAAAVISGDGVEFVLTLGTGIGTTLVQDGVIAPHLELAHHPLLDGLTYNSYIGDSALAGINIDVWRARVDRTIAVIDDLVFFDRLYIGGGNSRLLDTPKDSRIAVLDPLEALNGGVRLWAWPNIVNGYYPAAWMSAVRRTEE